MKKITAAAVIILALSLFSQSEDLMKMYQKLTGKDLTKEIETLKTLLKPIR